METVSTKKFLQTWLWILALVSLLAIPQIIQRANDLEIALLRSRWIGYVGIFALTALFSAWFSRSIFLDRVAAWMDGFGTQINSALHFPLGVFLITAGFLSVWGARLYVFGNILPQVMPILWVFLWAILVQAVGLKLIRSSLNWQTVFIVVVLAQGMVYHAYGIFAITSADPFSMSYAEVGRHYYASLFFSESLYGMKLPLPFLHPSRYLLLSIPFLVDGLPLWFHRFWQAFLWFGLTLAASVLLAKRMKLHGGMTALVTAWVFLYFLQGAVYYHLQVMVILILAGVSIQRPWRSFFFIVLASLWAGISRVNWFPVPAMLGMAIYILETPLGGKGWKYWITPIIWGAGGFAAALMAQFVYIAVSGNADVRAFGSSFTSDLLWNRLLPNETYPLGILPGVLLVSAPLWIGLYQMARGRTAHLHPLRWLGLFAMLAVLFAGGAVVSTKIGGGGDLHNMDAYLVMLGLVAMSFVAGQAAGEDEAKPGWGSASWAVVSAAVLIPMLFALPRIGFPRSYDRVAAEQDVFNLQQIVADATANGGEVLFVTERQLITFGYLDGVPLVPEYEQIELMEMAMSRNRPYLEQFYGDLQDRRFVLIIAPEQKYVLRRSGVFMEEDNAWVRFISNPLLCNYRSVEALVSSNVHVFEPRPRHSECRDPFGD
jgi:hypothetical protein